MPDLVERACDFARQRHAGQVRKWTKAPYWNHLHDVAELVRVEADGTDEMVAAAYLHDVIEDTSTKYDEVAALFGDDVANMVLEVTNPSRHEMGIRKVRVAIDRQYLAGASGYGQTIKLADLINNCSDVVDHDIKFAQVYLAEKWQLLGVLTKGRQHLWNIAWATLKREQNRLDVRLTDAG
jgi:(p)ppGpp synthase/HD superfamily hydrolase